MFDIRVSPRFLSKVINAYSKSKVINHEVVVVHADPAVDEATEALIMVTNSEGAIVEWGFRGISRVIDFIEHGYMPVVSKICPYLRTKCVGEKCALYVTRNNVGDCAHVFAVLR